jgi:molecular chaperone GrpE
MSEQEQTTHNQTEPTDQPEGTTSPGPDDGSAARAELEAQVEHYKDLLLRKAAEFENYKRRAENEAAMLVKYANEAVIADILPVLDDLERSLKLSRERKDFESFIKGLELIHQKIMKVLASRGVKALESVGQPFSVDLHDALMTVPREDVPPHTVVEEIEKGYMLHDRVIRHAKVVVSADAPSEETLESNQPSGVADRQPEQDRGEGQG